jgi:hypothetical protein
LLPVHSFEIIVCLLKGIYILDHISSNHTPQLVDPLINWQFKEFLSILSCSNELIYLSSL